MEGNLSINMIFFKIINSFDFFFDFSSLINLNLILSIVSFERSNFLVLGETILVTLVEN
jgi:hypothetical protein